MHKDDLMSSLPANFRLNILDLRKPLARAKDVGRLYFRTDSHWNLLGAAIALDAIINRLSDLHKCCAEGDQECSAPKARKNAQRKMLGLKRCHAPVFWALGPDREGYVFA